MPVAFNRLPTDFLSRDPDRRAGSYRGGSSQFVDWQASDADAIGIDPVHT